MMEGVERFERPFASTVTWKGSSVVDDAVTIEWYPKSIPRNTCVDITVELENGEGRTLDANSALIIQIMV